MVFSLRAAGVVQNGRYMGYTESGQRRANQRIPRFACNPDLNHAVRLLLGGAVLLHHAPQRQLDGVAVRGHGQLGGPVQVGDAADVAADGRGPLACRAHGVDEVGDGLGCRRQRRHLGGVAPGGEDRGVGAQRADGVGREGALGVLGVAGQVGVHQVRGGDRRRRQFVRHAPSSDLEPCPKLSLRLISSIIKRKLGAGAGQESSQKYCLTAKLSIILVS